MDSFDRYRLAVGSSPRTEEEEKLALLLVKDPVISRMIGTRLLSSTDPNTNFLGFLAAAGLLK